MSGSTSMLPTQRRGNARGIVIADGILSAARRTPDKLALRERVGPPYFIAALDAIRSERKRLEEERNHWKALSDAYANGRIMRVLRWLKTGRANLPS